MDKTATHHFPLKRADILLFAGILLLAFCCFAGYHLFFQKDGAAVEITVDGKSVKTLPLNKDTRYKIKTPEGHQNILKISNGSASITDADCPDKLCVYQKKISKKGETLVCLPHKVVVSVISSSQDKSFDGISR